MTIFCIENVHFLKNQRWEFIKENKKVRTQERKQELDQENDQEKTKVFFFLGRLLGREGVIFDRYLGRVLVFLLTCFLL